MRVPRRTGKRIPMDANPALDAILMTQRMWISPSPPDVCRAFWKLAYEAAKR